MSCRRWTAVLRIPASALGFRYRREWDEFLEKHEDDFQCEPGYFGESLSDDYPCVFCWEKAGFHDPDRLLDQRDPNHPEIVPGPFLDYCLDEIMPLPPGDSHCGEAGTAMPLGKAEMEQYLPLYQRLFPYFTLRDMRAVRRCEYEWYDGTNAPYLYTDYD